MQKIKKKKLLFISLFIFLFISAFSLMTLLQRDANVGAWLYVAFDEVLNINIITNHNPLLPEELKDQMSTKKSWRCSTCHGMDYLGKEMIDGVTVNFPGLISVLQMEELEISNWFDGTNNPSHNFSSYLTLKSNDQLISFFKSKRFKKWMLGGGNEVESGNSSDGEIVYKDLCMECHSPQGEKINLGRDNSPEYFGDIAISEQGRVIHILEFGYLSHDSLIELDPSLDRSDIINVTKYLRGMATADTILQNQEDLDSLEFDDQGDLKNLVQGAIIIFFVILSAYFVVIKFEKK